MNVIGGADGPTALYVASVINWPLIVAAVAVAGAVLFFVLRRKKKRD